MKHLLTALGVFCAAAWGADTAGGGEAAKKSEPARKVAVSQCFKVHRLLKTDSTHYWADWSNTCPYTIDAVYVMVGFRDGSRQEMGSGVWPMYFVEPGVHRVTRFSAPVADFATVHVHGITTDSAIALKDPGPALPAGAKTAPAVGKVGDSSVGKVAPSSTAQASGSAPSSKPVAPAPRLANRTKY